MVDRAGRPGAGPVNGFEVVAGIVEEERGVVVLGIVRTRTGGPVVGQTGGAPGLRETVDMLGGRRDEGHVRALGGRPIWSGRRDPEVSPQRDGGIPQRRRDRERVESRIERRRRAVHVGDPNEQVVDRGWTLAAERNPLTTGRDGRPRQAAGG
jgi:hypothetical protein